MGKGALSPDGRTVESGRYTPYKISSMFLFACSSLLKPVTDTEAAMVVTDVSKSFWNTNVSANGVVIGLDGDAMLRDWRRYFAFISGTTDLIFGPPDPVTGEVAQNSWDFRDY
jgi:hypothetical protein